MINSPKENARFIHAARRGDVRALKNIQSKYRIPKMTVELGIKKAIDSNQLNVIKLLYKGNFTKTINSTDLVEKAAQQGKLEIVQFLVEQHGADTFSALKASLRNRRFSIVEYLFQQGETKENMLHASRSHYNEYEEWKHQKSSSTISNNKKSLSQQAASEPLNLKRRPKPPSA